MMRTVVFGIGSLIVGVVVGSLVGRQEFAHEALPLDTKRGAQNGSPVPAEPIGPRLTILAAERYDFGEMDRGATMTHTFEIQNDGDEPLTLTPDGTSCKCTSAGLSKDQLLPGDKAQITMEWNAKDAHEPFEQYAEYRTNDLRRPKFRLLVTGRISETLRAEPREAIFNRISSQEPAQATLKIFGIQEGELEIVSHKFMRKSTASFFSVQFRPLSAEEIAQRPGFKCGVEMTVNLRPGMPQGQIDQAIQITTNLIPEATFDIPVYGSIVSDISLVGQSVSAEQMLVSLGSFTSSKGAKSTIYMVVKGAHRDQTELKVAEVSPSAELTAQLGEPIRSNSQIVSFPLTLEVPPGTTPVSRMSAGGNVTVRIETTHPQIKDVTFRVKYAVVE